ncbi:FimD/PapC N-terminal domain-containing protein [Enterobacter kobei]
MTIAESNLTQFDGVEKILPGKYTLEVYSNLKPVNTWTVTFVAANNEQGFNACMTPEMVVRFDVDTSKLPPTGSRIPALFSLS